ncbi:MAG: hypothetical protein R3F02_18590 [Thiolinea sp.]
MSDKTIIPFPSQEADITDLANVQKPDKQYCRHARVILVESSRVIECRDCGSLVEPFDWALRWSDKNSREVQQVKQMRKERKSLLESIEKLRREEQNTKARLKRARTSLKAVNFTEQEVIHSREWLKQFREGEV